MELVLQEAVAHGFSVLPYILDPEYTGTSGQAAAIAVRTNIVGLTSRVLDGQRFGHINAQLINRRARIAA